MNEQKNAPLIATELQCECANCGCQWLEPTPIYNIECPACDYEPVIVVFSGDTKE